MKERIIFNEKTEVPDIVTEKCNMAYEQIRSEGAAAPKKIKHRRKTTIAVIAAAAAVACSVPVAATYFRSAFDVVSNEVYTKNPATQVNLSEYAKDVNNQSAQSAAEITMQSVFCDGESISIAFMLTPKDESLKNLMTISSTVNAKLNGKIIKTDRCDVESAPPLSFNGTDDGNYYGVIYFQQLSVEENSKLEISISNIQGVSNVYNWVDNTIPGDFYFSGEYVPETTEIFTDEYKFEETISPDTSNNKLYEVNETQDNITLESVFVTPFRTDIKLNGLSDRQFIRVFDGDGNEIKMMGDYAYEEGMFGYGTPLKTAREIVIEVFNYDIDGFPTEYSFTVPIEKGFADKYTVTYSNDDIIYNPPYEEMTAQSDKIIAERIKETIENADIVPLNTPLEKPYFSYKITGSEIQDIEGYTLEDRELPEGYNKLLLITYEVTNNSAINKTISFYGGSVTPKDVRNFEHGSSEPDYISYKEYGGKSSYIYDFEGNETKTITLGYAVPDNTTTDDFYVIMNAIKDYDEINADISQVPSGNGKVFAIN